MIKGVIITFNFDTETELVSNVLCNVDGVEKKKRVTKAKAKVEEEMAAEPLIIREETKLVFNNKVVADMAIEYEDRIVIKWEKQGKTLIPIIGKDVAFDEEGSGNKVTKTNTVGYKGKQNAVLAEFGEVFTIVPHKEGIWKLVSTTSPTTSKTLEDTIKAVEKVEADLITEKDEEIEIDEMQFTL
jgi:hypothetical protein